MDAIVLYPSPGMGHLISLVELGELILTHNPSFTVIILITTPPFKEGSTASSTASYIAAVSAATPSISFHQLPVIFLDPASYGSVEALARDLINLNNVHVRAALTSIFVSSAARSLIIDLFCYPALEIAAELDIPAYYFFTSNASCLALYLHIPSIYRNTTENLKDVGTVFHLPCLPPTPLNHLPDPTLARNAIECDFLIIAQLIWLNQLGILSTRSKHLSPRQSKRYLKVSQFQMFQLQMKFKRLPFSVLDR